MGDNSITYEELFELLRRERNSEELQTLDPNFYPDLVQYFQDKKKVIEDKSEEAQIFGSSEKEKVKVQLDNAKKIAKELIERREKKIIILALNKARTESDIIDTSSLLDVEKEFFHQAAALFSSYKKGVLNNVVSMKNPVFGDTVSERKTQPESVEEGPVEQGETGGEEKEVSVENVETGEKEEKVDLKKEVDVEKDEKEVETQIDAQEGAETSESSVSEEKSGKVSLKFNSPIPRFMGKDEEVYGPYEPEQAAEVPEEIAKVLIKKGKAEPVEQ